MQFSGIDLDADGSANGKKHLINPRHFLKIQTRHSSSFPRWPELRAARFLQIELKSRNDRREIHD
jgi:hypothetical protein